MLVANQVSPFVMKHSRASRSSWSSQKRKSKGSSSEPSAATVAGLPRYRCTQVIRVLHLAIHKNSLVPCPSAQFFFTRRTKSPLSDHLPFFVSSQPHTITYMGTVRPGGGVTSQEGGCVCVYIFWGSGVRVLAKRRFSITVFPGRASFRFLHIGFMV